MSNKIQRIPLAPLPFHGRTTRGRETRAASLLEAVDDLAFLRNIPGADAITCTHDDRVPGRTWVYESQAKLDADVIDLADGTISEPGRWFAVVDAVGEIVNPQTGQPLAK